MYVLSSRQFKKHHFLFVCLKVFVLRENHKTYICVKQDVGETQWFQIIYLKKERIGEDLECLG